MRFTTRAILLALFMLPVDSSSAQQSVLYATLSGTVLDPTGSGVAHADVAAVELGTNVVHRTKTDAQGTFRFTYLPPGTYGVEPHADGFIGTTQKLDLGVGAEYSLKLNVSVASVRATVEVKAQPSVIEDNRSQIGEAVTKQEAQALPFAGRNYLDLALLLPGVSPTNTASTQTLAETSEVVGQGYSINSQRNFSNSFVVDGLSANDDAAGVTGNVFGLDTIREFQVVTSGGQAEFGRALGGYFNIVTNSGSNAMHGGAYGFLRNQRLNADNALSGSRLPLTQGVYGASLSGPLHKDHTFLFGNFEEQRLRSNGVITVSAINALAINTRLEALGYKAPLLPITTGATTPFPTTLHTDTLFVRLDHRLSSNDQLGFRYSLYQLSSLNARGVGGLNEVSNGTSVYDANHTFALSNVAMITPKIVNETRAQFVTDNLSAPPNDTTGPAVTIAGVAVFGRSTSSPTARVNYLGEVVDNLLVQKGREVLKAGVDFLENHDTITYPQALLGNYSFACLYDTASEAPSGYAGSFCANSLYSGRYNTQGFTQNFGQDAVTQSNPNVGIYAQDEWKAGSKLTVHLGIRYDLQFLQTIAADTNNVSPRVGFAWSPYGSGRTLVRASYGLFYDRVPLRPLANALLSANNTINSNQARFLSYTFSTTDVNAPLFPQIAVAPPPAAKPNFALMDSHIQNPYSQQASLGIEQQLWKEGSLGVSYQHVRGEHLISSLNTNINPDGSRPDPTRGNIKPYTSAFDSYFDGLEVSFVQRPATWGAARVSYTWSKAIDDVGEFFFSSPINNFNLRVDRSRSDDDQRHRVVFDGALNSSSAEPKTMLDHITHGWSISGILQYYSRLPFNVTTGTTTRQGTTQRPCSGALSLTGGSGTNACTEALAGAVIGRNAGVGFDFFSLNTRLTRTFALGERVKLEAIAEAFNALNHRNDMIPNATFGTGPYSGASTNSAFGKSTAVGDPRSVELAARIKF